jgi:hypothetical protein
MKKILISIVAITISTPVVFAQWNTSNLPHINNTNSGNVGIGTSDPATKLEVMSSNRQLRLTDSDDNKYWQLSASSASLAFRFQEDQTDEKLALYLNSSGNVGIGTNSPSVKLHVYGGAFKQVNADLNSGIYLDAPVSNEPMVGWRVSDNSERFRVHLKDINSSSERLGFYKTLGGTAEVFSVLASGNVGVGISAPAAKLHVYGGAFKQVNSDLNSGIFLDAPATNEPMIGWRVSDNSERFRVHLKDINSSTERLAFYKTVGGTAEVFSVLASGNVGIGTTHATSKLTVAGNIACREVSVTINAGQGPSFTFRN